MPRRWRWWVGRPGSRVCTGSGSPLFRLSSRVAPDLDALLRPALQDEVALMQVLACPRLALGIDAPLAFPRALADLLAGWGSGFPVPQREIDNPYAYRDCERWLYQHYGKKPLSATFDRLGNNATLALPCCRASGICNWCQNGRGLPGARCWRSIPPWPKWGQSLCCAARAATPPASNPHPWNGSL